MTPSSGSGAPLCPLGPGALARRAEVSSVSYFGRATSPREANYFSFALFVLSAFPFSCFRVFNNEGASRVPAREPRTSIRPLLRCPLCSGLVAETFHVATTFHYFLSAYSRGGEAK